MAERIFGPIRGAGVQVREKEAERNLVPGVLGSTVMMGVFERGKENDISIIPSKRSLLRKMGGLLDPADFNAASIASLEAPLACEHYWQHSDGAGFMVCFRVCPATNSASSDERPTKSTMEVYSRGNVPVIIATLTAHNGGRWAGQSKTYLGRLASPAPTFPSANSVTLDAIAAKTFQKDEFKGATLHIHDITTKTYIVTSNTTTGTFTVGAEEDLPADWLAAAPHTDYGCTIFRDDHNYRGEEKYLSVEFTDGGLDPAVYFGMKVAVDGQILLNYEDLSMDTRSPYYWVNVVNNDPNNDLLTVTEDSSFALDRTLASTRPGNRCGLSKTLTAATLGIADPYVVRNTSAAWVPVITWDSWGTTVVPQYACIEVTTGSVPGPIVYTLHLGCKTIADAIATPVVAQRSYTDCPMASSVPGVASTPAHDDEYFGKVTVAAGAGTAVVGDKVVLALRPLPVNGLIGGKVNPKTSLTTEYSIISNTRTTVTVSTVASLLTAAVATDPYLLRWPERFSGGYDGYITGMTANDYTSLLDSAISKLLKLKTMNLGLVKMSVPGIGSVDVSPYTNSIAIQRAARDLCLAYNWEYRVEIPDEYTSEADVVAWLKTFGRIDLCVAHFPTFAYIRDPLADAGSVSQDKLVSLQGMILGREAYVAQQYDGYHKAAAGVDVTLPLVIRSTHLGKADDPIRVNEEYLNPAGVNCLRWATGGNTVIVWGDRTLDTTTAMRWKHKREQLSHYENILLEGFDWAIFQINDEVMDAVIDGVLSDFFLKEYRKRALRGSSFRGGTDPACIIKIDKENNTDATRALGELNVEVSLKFADTVERLKFLMGAMGITE